MHNHYHLIGIGGIGMSGIAQLLLCCGFKVSGSDLKESQITKELQRQGAEIFIGHRRENIRRGTIIVYSSAIKEDNPEMREAKRLRLTLLKRAQALAKLMQDKTVITVTGSHGKTTTTSLVSCLLLEAGLHPTAVIGGIFRNIESNACLGKGEFFVAEADESDGSFLFYQPKYSIITNIDREHLDYYQDFQNELSAFREFMHKTKEGGCLFACEDDLSLKRLLADYKKSRVSFGLKDSADIYAKNIQLSSFIPLRPGSCDRGFLGVAGFSSQFDCFHKHKFVAHFILPLAGEHNISNALSVIALGLELGIDIQIIQKALSGYKGAKRRLEIKFNEKNILVLDDYAHHPTEIKATLSAVKNLQRNRVIAVFQPHRYTRTRLLLEEFGGSFEAADYIILTDIYPASEAPIPGVSSSSIADKIKEHSTNKEIILLDKEEILKHILEIIKPGDLVIILGAGDIVRVSEELSQELNAR